MSKPDIASNITGTCFNMESIFCSQNGTAKLINHNIQQNFFKHGKFQPDIAQSMTMTRAKMDGLDFLTHKGYSITHPIQQTMERLLWIFWRKMIML